MRYLVANQLFKIVMKDSPECSRVEVQATPKNFLTGTVDSHNFLTICWSNFEEPWNSFDQIWEQKCFQPFAAFLHT